MCDRGLLVDTRRSAMYGMPKNNRPFRPRYECLSEDPAQRDDTNGSTSSRHLDGCADDPDCQCRDRIIAVTDHEEQHIRELRDAHNQGKSSGTTTPSTKSVHENEPSAAEVAQGKEPIPEEYLAELLRRAKDVIPPKYIDEIARRVKRDNESPDSRPSSVTPPTTSHASPPPFLQQPESSLRRCQSSRSTAPSVDARTNQNSRHLSPHSAHTAHSLQNRHSLMQSRSANQVTQVYTTAPYFNPLRSSPRPRQPRPISTVSEVPGPTTQLSTPCQLRTVSSSPSLKSVTTNTSTPETLRIGRKSFQTRVSDRNAMSQSRSSSRSRPNTSERGNVPAASSHVGMTRSSSERNSTSLSQYHRSPSPSPRSSPRLAVRQLQRNPAPSRRSSSLAPRSQATAMPLDPKEKEPMRRGLPARKYRMKLHPVEPRPLQLHLSKWAASTKNHSVASSSSSLTTTPTPTTEEEEASSVDDAPKMYIRDVLLKLKASAHMENSEIHDNRELDNGTVRSKNSQATVKKFSNDHLMLIVSDALERSGYRPTRGHHRGQVQSPSARSLSRA